MFPSRQNVKAGSSLLTHTPSNQPVSHTPMVVNPALNRRAACRELTSLRDCPPIIDTFRAKALVPIQFIRSSFGNSTRFDYYLGVINIDSLLASLGSSLGISDLPLLLVTPPNMRIRRHIGHDGSEDALKSSGNTSLDSCLANVLSRYARCFGLKDASMRRCRNTSRQSPLSQNVSTLNVPSSIHLRRLY